MPVINYKIIYNKSSYEEIIFENFFDGPVATPTAPTPADITTFKTALKTLLEKQDSTNVKAFIEQLIIVAGKNSIKNFDTTTTTEPFIFAIDTITDTKIQRTYLTFTGTNSDDAKVFFNQYSVDTTIFNNINTELSIFNNRLITMKYSDYTALTAP